jgi:hypothetical protein
MDRGGAKGTGKKAVAPVVTGGDINQSTAIEEEHKSSVSEQEQVSAETGSVSDASENIAPLEEKPLHPDCFGPTAKFKSYCR